MRPGRRAIEVNARDRTLFQWSNGYRGRGELMGPEGTVLLLAQATRRRAAGECCFSLPSVRRARSGPNASVQARSAIDDPRCRRRWFARTRRRYGIINSDTVMCGD